MNKAMILTAACALMSVGCANTKLGDLGGFGSMFGNSYVSGSQIDSFFKAGGKLAKGASGLTEEQEYYLGRGVAATVFTKYKPMSNAALLSYVNKVGATVAAVSDRPETFGGYHVMILDSNEINALSAPGGYIFVTKGFLKIMPDEDALAAVLAHEVGHIVLGHGTKAISQANITEALLIVGKEAAASQGGTAVQAITSTFGDSITDVTNTILTKGYSRSQEYDADEYAATLMKRAGYNAGGLTSMLQALQTVSKDGSGGWMSTHPDPKKRQSEVEDAVEDGASAIAAASQSVRAARFKSAMKSLG